MSPSWANESWPRRNGCLSYCPEVVVFLFQVVCSFGPYQRPKGPFWDSIFDNLILFDVNLLSSRFSWHPLDLPHLYLLSRKKLQKKAAEVKRLNWLWRKVTAAFWVASACGLIWYTNFFRPLEVLASDATGLTSPFGGLHGLKPSKNKVVYYQHKDSNRFQVFLCQLLMACFAEWLWTCFWNQVQPFSLDGRESSCCFMLL